MLVTPADVALQVKVRDLVQRNDIGVFTNNLTLNVGAQVSRTIKLTPLKCDLPALPLPWSLYFSFPHFQLLCFPQNKGGKNKTV